MPRIVSDQDAYPIKPEDINTNEHFWNAFGNNEREVSAAWIVMFMKSRGGWTPFRLAELNDFCHQKWSHDFRHNGLFNGRLVVEIEGVFYVTHEFIARCWQSSPIYKYSIVALAT